MHSGHALEFAKLCLIFGSALTLIAINRTCADRRQKRWHATVRLALEKGQPIPAALADPASLGSCNTRAWRFRGGLMWIAVGTGVLLAHTDRPWPWHEHGEWVTIPFCVGIGMLLSGLLLPKSTPSGPDLKAPGAGAS